MPAGRPSTETSKNSGLWVASASTETTVFSLTTSVSGPASRHDVDRDVDGDLLAAETRTEFGKGAARRIRREDKIPAVIYGHGNEPIHVTLPGHDTMMALKHGGANALLELDIDGNDQLALTKQVQVDPIRRVLEHIDFVAVRNGEKVTVDVPVHLIGEAARETLVVTENADRPARGRGHPHPRVHRGRHRGRRRRHPDPRLRPRAPRGQHAARSTPETLIVNITELQTAEALEAELEEAEAEAGIERDEPEPSAEAQAAEGAPRATPPRAPGRPPG